MWNTPLHPAVVHLPLGLAFLLPVVALLLTFALWRGGWPRSVWAVLVVLQLMLVGGGVVALLSGEQEEERVERVVSESVIEQHEEQAEAFVWTAGGVLALAAGVLVMRREGLRRVLTVAVTAGTFVVAGLAVWTGHSGGELVYKHGAASAYTSAGPAGGGANGSMFREGEDD
ncbi:MAG TPA: DUF2231 domain-containing protein [Myxococcaceae bacterium]|nr:DUF2231 domain-containing protein [Myxococcaceae bacterium]